MSDEAEFEHLVREMRRHFLVPSAPDVAFSTLDALIGALDPRYQFLAQSFRHNLSSMLSSLGMPYALVSGGTQMRHFQRIHMAERIRALPIEPEPTRSGNGIEEVREREAYENALSKMADFHDTEEGRTAMIRDICTFLLDSVESEDQKFAASELIRQGIILLWSAFEILFRDTFELELNIEPSKVEVLANDMATRKRFEVEKFPLDTLVQSRFDLSDKMGTILVGQQDFSDLPLIKSVYSVLFASSTELTTCLNQPNLWLLYQRRHLSVHRRGIVDQTYLTRTSDTVPLGSTLEVTPMVFEEHFEGVLKTGESLLRCLPSKNTS